MQVGWLKNRVTALESSLFSVLSRAKSPADIEMKSHHFFSFSRPSRTNMVLGFKAGFIVAATLMLFLQDLTIVASDALQSEFTTYILIIPFLFSFLIYRKRKMIKASITFESSSLRGKVFPYKEIAGALLFLLAFLVYSYGSFTFTSLEYHLLALPIFVIACILILFNPQTLRQLAFPIIFLFFLTPPPLQIVYQAGATLSGFSSQAAYILLKTFGLPVSLTSQYNTPAIILQQAGGQPLSFVVDIACSGIYSLMGFMVFITFVSYAARSSLSKKALVFLIGFPFIYALNILRITIIVLIGSYAGMDLATQLFHLLGGWFLIFGGTLLLLLVSEKIFKIRFFGTKSKTTSCNYCNHNPINKQHFCFACGKLLNPKKSNLSKRDLSKIAILAISVILLINLQVPVFAIAQGPDEATIQTLGGEQTVDQILPEIHGYTTQFIYRDKDFEELSHQDASLSYSYNPINESETTIWVSVEIAETRYSLHPWETCLIIYPQTAGLPQEVTQLSISDVQLLQNPAITARYFAFKDTKSNITQVVLYWYETAIFNTESSQEQKHVKISLIAYTDNSENILDMKEQLIPIAKIVASHWDTIKTVSQIALLVFQNGLIFIAITVATLAVMLIYLGVKNRKEKKSNLKIYNKLALQEEKVILQVVQQISKKEKATTNTIASYYQKLTGKTIKPKLLVKKLEDAEKVGLIKKKLVSQDDEPIFVWRSQLFI